MKKLFLFPSVLIHGLIVLALAAVTTRVVIKLRPQPPPVITVVSDTPPPPVRRDTPAMPTTPTPPPPPPTPPVVPPATQPARAPSRTSAHARTNLPPRTILPPHVIATNKPAPPVAAVVPPPLRSTGQLQTITAIQEAEARFEAYSNKIAAGRTAIKPPPVVVDAPPTSPDPSVDDAYILSIRTAIRAAWKQPPNVTGKCVTTFRLGRDGRVTDVRMKTSSGVAAWDAAALTAVQEANYPPFPPGLNQEYLDLVQPFDTETL